MFEVVIATTEPTPHCAPPYRHDQTLFVFTLLRPRSTKAKQRFVDVPDRSEERKLMQQESRVRETSRFFTGKFDSRSGNLEREPTRANTAGNESTSQSRFLHEVISRLAVFAAFDKPLTGADPRA
jgi:hypothetical protein